MSSRQWLLALAFGSLLALAAPAETPPAGKAPRRVDAAGDPLPGGALARLGTVRLRHEGETSVTFSPDGGHLVSVGGDNALHVWSASDGRRVRSFSRPGVKFSLSKSGHIYEGMDRLVLVQLQGGAQNWARAHMVTQHGGLPGTVAYSADGRWLACADGKKGLGVWDTVAGMQVRRIDGETLTALALSPDGRLLAAAEASADKRVVRVWDLHTGRELWKLKHPGGAGPQTLRFSPDGKLLAGKESYYVRLWSVATGKSLRSYMTMPQQVMDFTFSPDSKYLATVATGRNVQVWETDSEEEAGTVALADQSVLSACFLAGGQALLTWSDDRVFRQWDWRQGKEQRRWDGPELPVQALAPAPDGKRVVAVTADGALTLWDVAAGKEVGPARSVEARTLAFADPNTLFLYTAEGDAQWAHWQSGKVTRRRAKPSAKGMSFAAHARGQVQAWNDGEKMGLIDARTGKTLAQVEGLETLAGMTFSPDGRLAAFAHGDGTVRLWDLAAGKETRRLEVAGAGQMAISHDGKTLAMLGPEFEVHLWELATGERRGRFRGTQGVVQVLEFTPDDRLLVAACADESVRVWDPFTGRQVRTLVGHFGSIDALAVSPDCRRLASAGHDGVVRVWDLGTGKEERRLEGHRGQVNALAFSADGKRLASAGKDTTVLVWDLTAPPPKAAPAETRPAGRPWEDLGRADAETAFRAMGELTADPEGAVALFRGKLTAEAPVKPGVVEALIKGLTHEKYAVRESANTELEAVGGQARPQLVKALAARPDGEAQKRLQRLVDLLDGPVRSPEGLRAQRAVEVLERIGTPAALELLDQYGRGAPGARLTQHARDAGRRVRARLGVKSP